MDACPIVLRRCNALRMKSRFSEAYIGLRDRCFEKAHPPRRSGRRYCPSADRLLEKSCVKIGPDVRDSRHLTDF